MQNAHEKFYLDARLPGNFCYTIEEVASSAVRVLGGNDCRSNKPLSAEWRTGTVTETRRKKGRKLNGYYRCYAEISLEAIGHNVDEVKRRLAADVRLMAVVKADAYGHGAVAVSRYLEPRADYFAVATVEEATKLRDAGIRLPILVLGYTSPREYDVIVRYDITQTIDSYDTAKQLDASSKKQKKRAKLHVALDTGMTRIGFPAEEKAADEIRKITRLSSVEVEGIYTHFSCADQKDKTYCKMQIKKYESMLEMLRQRGVSIPLRHVCNSAGIMEFGDGHFDMVRSGIVMYGLYPSGEVQKNRLNLQPALRWKAHVIRVRDVERGTGVSYGADYITEKPLTKIATVSAGYADGYPRALSSRGRVLIHGQYAPVLGRVCMDQLMVDVSGIADVRVEDIVTLAGRDGENVIPIEEVADPAARFNYEMVCSIGKRVVRIY